jgi:hypothetical protein
MVTDLCEEKRRLRRRWDNASMAREAVEKDTGGNLDGKRQDWVNHKGKASLQLRLLFLERVKVFLVEQDLSRDFGQGCASLSSREMPRMEGRRKRFQCFFTEVSAN